MHSRTRLARVLLDGSVVLGFVLEADRKGKSEWLEFQAVLPEKFKTFLRLAARPVDAVDLDAVS